MRALLAITLLAACSSDPQIRCATADQCLSGQDCVAGTCATASSSLADSGLDGAPVDATDGGNLLDVFVPIPDAPVCTPACGTGQYCTGASCGACTVDDHCGATCAACGGATPHCDGAACVQCTLASDCPITSPCCVNHACQLLGC